LLCILGCLLAVANLWYTAVRSTIPIAIDGIIEGHEKRLEKKPGVDDVFIITMDGGWAFQVDAAIFDATDVSAVLHKNPWSSELSINSEMHRIDWSTDFRRMCIVMPIACLAMIATLILTWRRLGESSITATDGENPQPNSGDSRELAASSASSQHLSRQPRDHQR